MKFAFIKNDVVSIVSYNLSEDEAAIIGREYQATIKIEDEDPTPEPGWAFIGGSIVNPNGPIVSTKISKLKFLERFTDTELATIEGFASGSSAYALAVRVALRKQQVAEFIDLSLAATVSGTRSLVALGLLTNARADEILLTPVSEYERYKG